MSLLSQESLDALLGSHTFGRTFKPNVKLSVILSYFERPEYIVKSLAAVKAHKSKLLSPGELEIIVVDDGSQGGEIENRLPDDVIYLWQRKYRFGLSRSRNVGAKIANGRYLFFLDSDLLMSESYFDAALRNFEKFGDRVLQTGFIWDYAFRGAEDIRMQFGCWENPNTPCNRFLHLAGGIMAISAAVYREVGGFDEDLIYGGWEDMVFGHLVGKLPGTAIIYNANMECRHMPHPPGLRWLAPAVSLEIVQRKYPDFIPE